MRAISPVVAITILILMTIAAAAMAYLTIVGYQEQAGTASQSGVESLTGSQIMLRIESVAEGDIYLRNLATNRFTGAKFYLDGAPLETAGPGECVSGQVCVFVVSETLNCSGTHELSMGRDVPIPSRTVTCCDLGFCATENYTISQQASSIWTVGSQGYYSAVLGFSGSRKILTLGDVPSDLRIWNVTGATMTLENTTTIDETAARGAVVVDLDGDTYNEFLVLTDTNNHSNLTILNYTQPTTFIENLTEWDGQEGLAFYAENLDADPGIEVVVIGKTSTPTQLGVRVMNYSQFKTQVEGNIAWEDPSSLNVNDYNPPSIYIADVDSDSVKEILAMYVSCLDLCGYEPCCLSNLNITNWDGSAMHGEHGVEGFVGRLRGVYAADVDNDSQVEILVVGEKWNATADAHNPMLAIWAWDGSSFTIETEYTWSVGIPQSVRAKDLNGDGIMEIVVGSLFEGGDRGTYGSIKVFNWDGSTLEQKTEYGSYDDFLDYTSMKVDIYDVDEDGKDEILAVTDDLYNNAGLYVFEYGLV
jgi:flagellin-like protein